MVDRTFGGVEEHRGYVWLTVSREAVAHPVVGARAWIMQETCGRGRGFVQVGFAFAPGEA